MLTFLVCLTALVIAYFTYGRYLERVAAIDPARSVPSETLFDGVDYVPMPRWRVFLIQLLNIAGTGPIFGAILGAAFGPVAFLWITLGGIFMGAMHDFLSGVMLVRNDGLSIPEAAGRYLGTGMRQFMRLFSVVLLVLVGAVFLLSPADILSGMVPSVPHTVWVWLILAYYFVATLLPIDKIIGKIYPIFGVAPILMALALPLPKQVFGHPWLLMNGGKMSKSKGNVIYAEDLVDLFGVDAVRYFVLHEMPFESDGTITWDLMIERTNSDLANTLGNLVNRTISMTNKYFGGVVENKNVVEDVDNDLKSVVLATKNSVQTKMDQLRVADAISEIFTLFKRCNKYIDETMPWALAKDEAKADRLSTVLYNLVESITIGAALLTPFMPDTAEKIVAQLGTTLRAYDTLDTFGVYPNGGKVTDKPEILFARIDPKEMGEKIAAVEAKYAPKEEPKKEIEGLAQINIEDFAKVELRAAKVVACEPIKRAKKLLKLTLDDGTSTPRTVASGIAKWYKPEDLIGHTVIVVANLKPAVLCGVESQGMILAADAGEDDVRVVFVDGTPAGSKIR